MRQVRWLQKTLAIAAIEAVQVYFDQPVMVKASPAAHGACHMVAGVRLGEPPCRGAGHLPHRARHYARCARHAVLGLVRDSNWRIGRAQVKLLS